MLNGCWGLAKRELDELFAGIAEEALAVNGLAVVVGDEINRALVNQVVHKLIWIRDAIGEGSLTQLGEDEEAVVAGEFLDVTEDQLIRCWLGGGGSTQIGEQVGRQQLSRRGCLPGDFAAGLGDESEIEEFQGTTERATDVVQGKSVRFSAC